MSVTDTSASVHNAATPMERLCINTIRTLSMDAVQAANSGHPGTPMAMAPLAYCLWQEFLRYDPSDPLWPNRDRFVLSAGHASMLLYSVLHLAGVKEAGKNLEILDGPAVRLEDIKNFRQLGSRCPGHPESHLTTGVDWVAAVEAMVADGVTAFVEVGPGRVLTGLIKRIAPDAEAIPLDDAAAADLLAVPFLPAPA